MLRIAHRHGNLPDLTRAALAAQVDLLEADVHLRRGVVEVRHADAMGPLHLDGWRPSLRPRHPLTLGRLLADVDGAAALLVDLKRGGPALAAAVGAALVPAGGARPPAVVCGRAWEVLAAVPAAAGARIALSAGTRAELRRLPAAVAELRPWGVSVDHRRLDEATVGRLRELDVVVLAWTVGSAARARQLVGWGVGGIVADSLSVLASIG